MDDSGGLARGVRVRPRPWIAIALVVQYVVVVTGLRAISYVRYDEVLTRSALLVRGLVIPAGGALLVLVVLTTALGWWRPALFEARPTAPRWVLALPALMVVLAVTELIPADLIRVEEGFLAWLIAGVTLVSAAEELLFRGLVLVALRGRLREGWVWLGSSLLFSALQAMHVLFGLPVSEMVTWMISAFLAASAFYATRLATGTLMVPVLTHAFWTLSVYTLWATGNASLGVVVLMQYALGLFALVAVWWTLRRPTPAPPKPKPPSTFP